MRFRITSKKCSMRATPRKCVGKHSNLTQPERWPVDWRKPLTRRSATKPSMSSSVAQIRVRETLGSTAEVNPERVEVRCPVCGSECASQPLYRYTATQAAAHFCPPTRDLERNRRLHDCIDTLWHGSDCTIHRCDECGFAFGYPFVGGDEEFYRLLHEQKEYPAWRWDYDVAIGEAVRKFEGGRILDVGAGVGMFLRELEGSWECYAIEGSEVTRGE